MFDEADRIVETGHFPEVEQIMNFIQQKNENFEDLNSSPTSLSTTTNTETQPNNESFEEEKRLLIPRLHLSEIFLFNEETHFSFMQCLH